MAIIYTYPDLGAVDGSEKLLVTDGSDENNTKTVTTAAYGAYINATYGGGSGSTIYQANGSIISDRTLSGLYDGSNYSLTFTSLTSFNVESPSLFTGTIQLDSTITIPTGASNGYVLTSDGTGIATWQAIPASTILTVNGTANRISVADSGGPNPVIDIDATYVGQGSITTLGTITTGIWNGTAISPIYGGTGQTGYSTGDIIYSDAPSSLDRLGIGTTGQVLTVSGSIPTWSAIPTQPAEDLATTLAAGNTTGGTDIEMTTSDDIVATASDPAKTVHVDFGILPTARRVQITTDNKGFLTPWMTIDNSSFSLNYGSTSSLVVNNNSIDVETGFFRVKNTNYGRFAPAPLTVDRVYTFQDETGVVPVGPAWDTLIANPTVAENGYVISWNNGNSEYELVPQGAGGGGIYGGSGSVSVNTTVNQTSNTVTFQNAGDGYLEINGNAGTPTTDHFAAKVVNSKNLGGSTSTGLDVVVDGTSNNANVGVDVVVDGSTNINRGVQIRTQGSTAGTNTALFVQSSNGTTGSHAIITSGGNSGFGTSTPDSSALLDISSTTQGFLPPRMTSAEMVAIGTPAEGLIVHATDADRPHYNDGTSWKGFGDLYGLYSQTAASSNVTGTTPASVVGTGVGSLTVPANGFKVGDSFHAKIGGEITHGNGDTITIDVLADGTVLATTGSISLTAATANGWEIELDFTMQTIGATASVVTNGNFAYNRNSGSLEGFVFQDTQTIDTTVANSLDIRVTWGQTGSTINSTNFVLHRTFAGS